MFETPILFLIFNRPDLTYQVFQRIAEVKPKYLFIAADGPREDRAEDVEKCRKARETVLSAIDWDCKVKTLFRETNLGCGLAVSQAITWFFDNVEQGIILEDDCLPDHSFFSFCQALLEKYQNNVRVGHIGGSSFISGFKGTIGSSYFFSKYPHIWGWATWKRVWDQFNFQVHDNRLQVVNVCKKYCDKKKEIKFWTDFFCDVFHENKHDTWGLRYHYAIWKNNYMAILPALNLVENLGFRHDATHTTSQVNTVLYRNVGSIGSIIHPISVTINKSADNFNFDNFFSQKSELINKVRNILYKIIPPKYYNSFKKVAGR